MSYGDFMKNKSMYLIILLCVSMGYAQKPAMPPKMNEAEMKQLESEIADFQKQLQAMPEEEQAAFFQSMEQAVQKIDELSKTEEGKVLLDKLDKGSISDEELDQLINQIVGDEEPEVAVPVEEPKEEPKVIVKPKPVVVSSKHQQAIDTINAIIAHSNAFIVKAATVPELPGKIIKWQKHKLVDWKPGLTWNKLKTDIEQFVSYLNILLERDQKTKEYYHIDEFLKEESLYNNLKKIQHIVSEYEPQIEEVSPLHKSLTKTSKRAFQKMLSQYSEALYTLNVIEELKKLVSKFQPKAKLAREEEEKAFQKAELEKKKKLTPGAPITVGRPETEYMPSPSKERIREPRVAPIPAHQVYIPEAQEPGAAAGAPSAAEKPGATPKDKGGKEKPGKKDIEKDEEEKEDKDTKKDEKEKDDRLSALKKQAEKIDEKTFREADKIVEKISDNITHIVDLLKKTSFFERLDKHIIDDTDIDFEFAIETMPELMRELSLRRGALGNIEQLHGKIVSPYGRATYKAKLEKALDKHKNIIEKIVNQLTTIEGQLPTLLTTMPKSKQYAYFAQEIEIPQVDQEEINKNLQEIEKTSKSVEEGLEKAVAYLQEKQQPVDVKLTETQQKIPTPVSLLELKKNIALLKDMINNFDKTTLPK